MTEKTKAKTTKAETTPTPPVEVPIEMQRAWLYSNEFLYEVFDTTPAVVRFLTAPDIRAKFSEEERSFMFYSFDLIRGFITYDKFLEGTKPKVEEKPPLLKLMEENVEVEEGE